MQCGIIHTKISLRQRSFTYICICMTRKCRFEGEGGGTFVVGEMREGDRGEHTFFFKVGKLRNEILILVFECVCVSVCEKKENGFV